MKVTNIEFKCRGTPVPQVIQNTVKYSPLFYFRPNLPASTFGENIIFPEKEHNHVKQIWPPLYVFNIADTA